MSPTPDEAYAQAQRELTQLRRELDRQHRLAEASYALHTTLDLDELLEIILRAASEGVRADRGTVFLLSEDGKELWSKVLQGEKSLEIRLPVGQGIAGSVGASGQALRIDDAYEEPRFDQSWDKKTGYRTKQILCAPIRNREGAIVGVFQTINRADGLDRPYEAEDEAFLEALSIHAALAVENARLHTSAIEKERQDREIKLVEKVQRSIQPERANLELGTLRAAGLNVLCEDASGDYYDFIPLPSGRLAVVIGDVSGHGLHAALVMAQARAFLRAFSATIESLEDVANLLNDFLARDLTGGSFMTLFLAILDPATGEMRWCSAGHLPALVHRADDGRIDGLPSTGRVLGIFPDAGYVEGEATTLAVGDTLLLYTDGATEANAPDGEMFRESRLRGVLAEAATDAPEPVLKAVTDALLRFTGGDDIGDDLTLVCVTRQDEVQTPSA